MCHQPQLNWVTAGSSHRLRRCVSLSTELFCDMRNTAIHEGWNESFAGSYVLVQGLQLRCDISVKVDAAVPSRHVNFVLPSSVISPICSSFLSYWFFIRSVPSSLRFPAGRKRLFPSWKRPDRHSSTPSFQFRANWGSFIGGVKRQGRKAVHSPPSNEWSCACTPAICLHDMQRDNFTFCSFASLIISIWLGLGRRR